MESLGITAEAAQVSGGSLFVEAVRSLFKPSPVQAPPNVSVFADRQQAPLTPYVVWAVLLLVMGLGASYGGEWLSYLGYTLAGYAAPLLYVVWMVRSDRYEREPLALVAYCFGWGAFIGIAAGKDSWTLFCKGRKVRKIPQERVLEEFLAEIERLAFSG